MATTDELTEGNVRVALGDRLQAAWTASNAAGYDPALDPDDPAHLDIHLGHRDTEKDYPQVGLAAVSAQQSSQSWNADGSGITTTYGGRIDATVYVGGQDDVDEHAPLLATTIGDEVRDIVDANTLGLPDPHTGEQLVFALDPLSEPIVQEDTELPETRYSARVEIGYERREGPQ